MKIYLYKITNILNGRIYYGKTSRTIEKRFQGHCRSALKPYPKSHVCRAIKKYGKENFTVEHLSYCRSNNAASQGEQHHIRIGRKVGEKLYNETDGGEGSIGYQWTVMQRKKLSDYHKNMSPVTRALRSKHCSQATRQGMKNMSLVAKALRRQRMCATHKRVRMSSTAKALRSKQISNGFKNMSLTAKTLWRKHISQAVKKAWKTQ